MPMTNRPSITDLFRSMTASRAESEALAAEGHEASALVISHEADMDQALIIARLGELTA